MPPAVAALIETLGALLKKWGAPLFAFWAGTQAAKKDEKLKDLEAEKKARENQDEKDLEFERLRGDDAVRERVRAVLEASRDSDG